MLPVLLFARQQASYLIKSSMARVMKYATLSRTGCHLFDQMLQAAMLHTRRVMHNGIEIGVHGTK
jgi:hypothetical protein